MTASPLEFQQASPTRIRRRNIRSGFQSQAGACTRGNRYSFGEMWRDGIAQMLRYGLMSRHVLRRTENIGAKLMPRNPREPLNIHNTLVRHLTTLSPISHDAGVIKPERRSGFGQAAKLVYNLINDALMLAHAAKYHTA